ncbi:MAG: hypothetical protein PHD01_01935 [Geobacteraceae bacterium]|nr:hypothetical protein [Geobacteraceae bacterium]
MYSTDFKLLHCMSNPEYLDAALSKGLMLTDHEVCFQLNSNIVTLENFIKEMFPLLENKLNTLGKKFETLEDGNKKVLLWGLGDMKGKMPMLSFTEVPTGKQITNHGFVFGSYGLVVTREWVERNGGDRVVYIGDNSTVTRNLFKVFAIMKISSLFVTESGNVVFENGSLQPTLDLLSHFQIREHVTEAEWRISGNHGFMGGSRDTGKCLPISLDDIEYIFVSNDNETRTFNKKVSELADICKPKKVPIVMKFSEQIPS